MRQCTKCGETKPPTEFSVRNRATGLLRRDCKACAANRTRQWYRKNTERAYVTSKLWRQRNKDKSKEYSRKWYLNNSEVSKAWRDANPDKMNEYRLRWIARNPVKAKVGSALRTRKYAHTIRNAPGNGVSVSEWVGRLEDFSWRCAYCGRSDKALTVEHMDPISKGGAHDMNNVVPACFACNRKKGTLTVLEFLTGFRFDGRDQRKAG